MQIAIGADHRGFPLKQQIAAWLRTQGHEVTDVGTNSTESTDYPLYAAQVARAPRSTRATGPSARRWIVESA